VLVWNEFDTGGAFTDVDGNFTLIVDGSDSASYLSMAHAGYRPTGTTTITVSATSHDAGTRAIMSKDEVLFSTLGGNVYMVRAGAAPFPIATTTDNEISPCRSESGLTVRWANATTRQLFEAAWDGSGATPVWTEPGTAAVLGISWSPRATFVWTNDGGTDAVVMAGEPSGVGGNFNYAWAGTTPDASPAAFGYFGPQPIEGNMIAFATGDGIWTAFPYFTDSFLVPERISSTSGSDYFPSWSPHRADGTLDLAFNRGYDVYTTRVSASAQDNVWSSATLLYGGNANLTDIAWAPETAEADDRLVFVVNPLVGGTDPTFEAGDLIVLSWNHTTGSTSGPTRIYDANGTGNVGAAANVSWR